jgi:asparagine synthase (glutamine-hydrolysing)
MCGIAGFLNQPKANIEKAKASLYHRGPDAQTSIKFKNLALVHTRLSIQDIRNGDQPFNIGDYLIVFNGEIYNHLILRKKISNYHFKSQSDTETLLALFIEYGEGALEMCDGMFAFGILNKKNNLLYLGRDRAGKKPLYYFLDNFSFSFASELNTLKNLCSDLEIDNNEIYSYIRNGFFSPDKTPFSKIYEVKPGSVYQVNLKTLKIIKKQFFNIFDYYRKVKITDYYEAINSLDKTLHESIKSRLLSSDLEVGAFLSGGIDSSLIVAIASGYVEKLKTFTVKFDGTFDESKLAQLTATKYNTKHYEIPLSFNISNDVEKIICLFGEPFMDSSAIPSYYVSCEAKKYVSVVLNGDGADELFGGYRRYVPIANNLTKIGGFFSGLSQIFPNNFNKHSYLNYCYRLLKLSNKKGLDLYNSATNDLFEDVVEFDSNPSFSNIEHVLNTIESEDVSNLSRFLIADFNLILQKDLLKKMDIVTMAHSLEGRSPFLSKSMLEFAPTIADKYKVKGLQTKVLLRKLGKKYLPKEIINQPKRGFEVPLKKWVDEDLKENIFDSLSGDSYSSFFLDKKFINDLLRKKITTSPEKRAKMLWTLYCLEIWEKNIV